MKAEFCAERVKIHVAGVAAIGRHREIPHRRAGAGSLFGDALPIGARPQIVDYAVERLNAFDAPFRSEGLPKPRGDEGVTTRTKAASPPASRFCVNE
jgi:hypothetical protein